MAQPAASAGHPAAEIPGLSICICPVDIFAQRQHVWIARPTLKAVDQEQSLATVHHVIAGSPAARSPPMAWALREQRADRGE
jgi:hypothetical protein